jgi:signal transduction histidine kinase
VTAGPSYGPSFDRIITRMSWVATAIVTPFGWLLVLAERAAAGRWQPFTLLTLVVVTAMPLGLLAVRAASGPRRAQVLLGFGYATLFVHLARYGVTAVTAPLILALVLGAGMAFGRRGTTLSLLVTAALAMVLTLTGALGVTPAAPEVFRDATRVEVWARDGLIFALATAALALFLSSFERGIVKAAEHSDLAMLRYQEVRGARAKAERELLRDRRLEVLAHWGPDLRLELDDRLDRLHALAASLRREVEGAQARHDVQEILTAIHRARGLAATLEALDGEGEASTPEVAHVASVVAPIAEVAPLTLPPHVALDVLGDAEHVVTLAPQRLERVLWNLLRNGADAMEAPGRLVLDIAPDGSHLRLRVTDEGCGMPPEVVERVFEPFYTSKPEGKGSGMGLPTVRAIVQEAGGRVAIDSAVGEGTTVTVELPRVVHPS